MATRRVIKDQGNGMDVLCKQCGQVWKDVPQDAGPAVLTAHLKQCPVPMSATALMTAISAGTYDHAIEGLLSALHNRKRYRRGDLLGSVTRLN